MGDIKGFLKHERTKKQYAAPNERVGHFEEFILPWSKEEHQDQAARCMDCGIPFCHQGCPLGNKIPDFNEAVYQGQWKDAFHILKSTNNFPEFTGRICPAPCEASCVLGLNNEAVNIEQIEKEIIETAFDEGWEIPHPIVPKTNKKIAVIGSGPAGLAVADELIKKGHDVTVYERDAQAGGLLRYGIPDFKLAKSVVARRVELMKASGIIFKTGVEVGKDITGEALEAKYDAVALCTGSTIPRDLMIEGRELKGVEFAMPFLSQQNQKNGKEISAIESRFNAKGKHVVVIGGGDTGADCLGTSSRQNAYSVHQIELLDKPTTARTTENPWPEWPMILTTSTSHEEGAEREWSMLTKRFIGENGQLKAIELVEIEWTDKAQFKFEEVEGSSKILPCDLALLAIGFQHTDPSGLIEEMALGLDQKGNLQTTNFKTSHPKFYAAGDSRRGQSLVVWAIAEGRKAAKVIHDVLMLEAL
ncbi:MAG: glutamate synthase (NADPH/NADH) small chain [Roseivirga sp.]|jgi:glutamate synthase (NADPH/NADH) small chain